MKTPKHFRVQPGRKLRLADWPTRVAPLCRSKEEYRERLEKNVAEMSRLQRLHYANSQHSVLLILQGMDTSGKDGTIRRVLSGINPQGCEVFSFKQPSAEELSHDFLWRAACRLPARGRIGIFNRSYYEEVLVVRVHPELLRGQGVPVSRGKDKSFWHGRFQAINAFERHLIDSNTVIVKIFLHISKEEQRKRLIARIDDAQENWKFSTADLHERGFWAQYMHAYERCLSATSSREAPWYIIPADAKEDARLIVSKIIRDTLQELKLTYPQADAKRRKELAEARKRLRGPSVRS